MAALAGTVMVVSMKDTGGTPAFQPIAGLRSRRVTINNELIDTTNADSTGLWREQLDAAGVMSASISGTGIFIDDAGFANVQAMLFAKSLRDGKFDIPGFGLLAGKFKCTQLELSGEYNGAVQYSMTFESSGAITYTTS